MKRVRMAVVAALLAATAGPGMGQGLTGENLLTGVPEGFKSGYDAAKDGQEIHELVPAGESVEDWSQMVTVQIFHGAANADVAGFATQLKQGWESACAGGAGAAIGQGATNGYPYVQWRFVCPLNGATGKPETMWLKAIAGADAAYVVQYAYRAEMTPEREQEALVYLEQTSACDSRGSEHPCPKGM